jgi:hypothetical protein
MVTEKVEGRELTWRGLFPWTELFRGFQVALDLNKLLLAAAGILVMAFGWWLLAIIFGSFYSKPDWPSDFKTKPGATVQKDNKEDYSPAWERFRREREQWNLMHETTNTGGDNQYYEVGDIAETWQEAEAVQNALKGVDTRNKAAVLDRLKPLEKPEKDAKAGDLKEGRAQDYADQLVKQKVGGTLSTWPWSENRGPNPFLLVTGQAGIPWESGHFWDWFFRFELLVVLEPVVKLVQPLVYFFSARAEGLPRFYFFLVFVWTVLTWSFFGGAITRIAAVQIARGEKIGLTDAVNFTVKRVVSFLTAPLFPIGFILVLIVLAIIFGLFQWIPLFGDFFSGILWVLPLILGLLIAVTLVGLVVGWPLMSPTISAEGTDSWEAVSRSFSYVFQKPFHYLWYSVVALAYGAILIFFVGFMGSFAVYMSKWAVAETPLMTYFNRDPTYLMVYAPDSFGWRPLLLQGAKVDGVNVVENGRVRPDVLKDYKERDWHWWNSAGAGLMAIWLGLIFLLVVGFGYSFFWSAVTIIYMLLRKVADGAELDEVYLDEDEADGVFGSSIPPPPAPPSTPSKPLTMVEPPALRTATTTTPGPISPSPTTPPAAPSTATTTEPSPPATTPPPSPNGGEQKPPS